VRGVALCDAALTLRQFDLRGGGGEEAKGVQWAVETNLRTSLDVSDGITKSRVKRNSQQDIRR
jgi:hypothetical protein